MQTPPTVHVEAFDFAVHPFAPSVEKRSRGMNDYAQDGLREAESKNELCRGSRLALRRRKSTKRLYAHGTLVIIGYIALTFVAAALTCPLPAQAAEARSALNRAGEQRMLSQRMVKAYGMMALGTMTRPAAEQLRDSIARFEANMVALGGPARQELKVRQAREDLIRAWTPFRAKLFELATPESVRTLARMGDELLTRAEGLVLALEPREGVASVLNIAGRQRMLSQRVAKAYVLIALGIDIDAMRGELARAAELFVSGLDTLGKRPENTLEIRRELQELNLQWEWLSNAIAMDSGASYSVIVAEAAEAILQIAERLTQLYERADIRGDVARLRKEP
jgi:PilJ/NarX-like methyl-accepting chemotaxis transducer